ncbi:hypothetical protein AB5J72_48195 [Streptomyces sp. CG1]|uniref:hypothetical protein n=1 Tax=Streptomyces sp. CG1 TaxID=1287523 RepID=UPI0034E1F389
MIVMISEMVLIPAEGAAMEGDLVTPDEARPWSARAWQREFPAQPAQPYGRR